MSVGFKWLQLSLYNLPCSLNFIMQYLYIFSCNSYIFHHAIFICIFHHAIFIYFIMQYLYISSCNIYIFSHFPFLSLFTSHFSLFLFSLFDLCFFLLSLALHCVWNFSQFRYKKYMTHSDIRNSTFATKTFGNDWKFCQKRASALTQAISYSV